MTCFARLRDVYKRQTLCISFAPDVFQIFVDCRLSNFRYSVKSMLDEHLIAEMEVMTHPGIEKECEVEKR